MSSHAATSPSLPGRRPRILPQQHEDDGLEVPTLDPRTLAIVTEMRSMREAFHARFDDVTVRLTAVARRHHHPPEHDDPVEDFIDIDPATTLNDGRRASTAPVHPPPDRTRPSTKTTWSPATLDDRFFDTTRGPTRPRPIHPLITPRHLPSTIPSASPTSPYGSIPLARYRSLPGAEQGRFKKALGRVGLSLAHILGSVDTADDDDLPDDVEALERAPPAQSSVQAHNPNTPAHHNPEERAENIIPGVNDTADDLLKAVGQSHPEVSPSTVFAIACIQKGVPSINGAPPNTFVLGCVELAERHRAFIGGDDLKTGQTKVKSVIAAFLVNAGIIPNCACVASAHRPRHPRGAHDPRLLPHQAAGGA
ncbi:unnamed protein product, partial [Tilletia caries]